MKSEAVNLRFAPCAAAAGIVLVLLTTGCPGGPGVDVPDPDTGAMVAPVARVIGQARDNVLQNPGSAEAWGRLGAVCEAHQLFDCAETGYRKALETAPNDFRWNYLLAIVQDIKGASAEEITPLFDAAIRISPLYPPVYQRFGDALTRQGDLPAARAAYEKAVERDPKFATAQRSLGQVLLSLNEPEKAVEHLEIAVSLQPEDSIVYSALARGYSMLGDEARADQAADESLKHEKVLSIPDPVHYAVENLAVDPQSLRERSSDRMQQGKFDEALPDLKLLEELYPDNARIQMSLGNCYSKLEQREMAIKHLKHALNIGEPHIGVHLQLANLLRTEGRNDEAIEQYRSAVALDPENVEQITGFAMFLAMSGDLDGAIEEFRRAADLAGSDPQIEHNLGTALMQRGDHDEALARFRKALELAPRSPNTLYNMATVYEKMGRRAEALDYYHRTLRIDPEHVAAQRIAALEGGS